MPRNCILFIFCFLFISCVKVKTDASNNGNGYADSQVVGSWRISGITSNLPNDWDGNGTPETNIYNTWTACQKDNLYQFSADKSGVYRFHCSATKTGVWQIYNTQTLAITTDGQGMEAEDIIYMTSDQFQTTRKVMTNGKTFIITKTWVRQ